MIYSLLQGIKLRGWVHHQEKSWTAEKNKKNLKIMRNKYWAKNADFCPQIWLESRSSAPGLPPEAWPLNLGLWGKSLKRQSSQNIFTSWFLLPDSKNLFYALMRTCELFVEF